MNYPLTALRIVGPDLLVRLVLVGVDGDPPVAVLGDLLLQRVKQSLFRIGGLKRLTIFSM